MASTSSAMTKKLVMQNFAMSEVIMEMINLINEIISFLNRVDGKKLTVEIAADLSRRIGDVFGRASEIYFLHAPSLKSAQAFSHPSEMLQDVISNGIDLNIMFNMVLNKIP